MKTFNVNLIVEADDNDATEGFVVISECINNKRKTAYGGFIWKKLIENS